MRVKISNEQRKILLKVITICGSLKFIDEMKYYADKLELDGNCVLSVIYPTKENKDDYTKDEIQSFAIAHIKKLNCPTQYLLSIKMDILVRQ